MLCREGKHREAVERTAAKAGVTFEVAADRDRTSLVLLEQAYEMLHGALEAERLATRLLGIGNAQRAETILREAIRRRDAPATLWRLHLLAEIGRGHWPGAWNSLKEYLRATKSPLVR